MKLQSFIAALYAVGVALFVVAAIVVQPIFTLAAINVLFGTEIPITIGTWLAAAWLWVCVWYLFKASGPRVSVWTLGGKQ